jgi:hypothetical protein
VRRLRSLMQVGGTKAYDLQTKRRDPSTEGWAHYFLVCIEAQSHAWTRKTFIYIADALGVLRCTSYISTLNLTDIRSIIRLISLVLGPFCCL